MTLNPKLPTHTQTSDPDFERLDEIGLDYVKSIIRKDKDSSEYLLWYYNTEKDKLTPEKQEAYRQYSADRLEEMLTT